MIWLLVEEAETGSFADGSTYCVLSAHRTEKGADDARDKWRAGHGIDNHKFSGDKDDDWCTCESGVSIAAAELQVERSWLD